MSMSITTEQTTTHVTLMSVMKLVICMQIPIKKTPFINVDPSPFQVSDTSACKVKRFWSTGVIWADALLDGINK